MKQVPLTYEYNQNRKTILDNIRSNVIDKMALKRAVHNVNRNRQLDNVVRSAVTYANE